MFNYWFGLTGRAALWSGRGWAPLHCSSPCKRFKFWKKTSLYKKIKSSHNSVNMGHGKYMYLLVWMYITNKDCHLLDTGAIFKQKLCFEKACLSVYIFKTPVCIFVCFDTRLCFYETCLCLRMSLCFDTSLCFNETCLWDHGWSRLFHRFLPKIEFAFLHIAQQRVLNILTLLAKIDHTECLIILIIILIILA